MGYLATMLRYAVIFGVIGFLGGYVGPVILTPAANQGPLLGIFITGPLGLMVGAAIGLVVAYIRSRR